MKTASNVSNTTTPRPRKCGISISKTSSWRSIVLKQLGVVFETYTERRWFKTMTVVSVFWLGILMWVALTGMLPETYVTFASILLIIWGMWIGYHLNDQ